MDVQTKKIGEIKPYEKNPRKNDEAVKYVAESIKAFGFKVPIVIDKDNVIVAGHTRYKAAKKLKLEEVPCIVADDLTEEQIKAFRLADNKVAEKAEWDFDLLSSELDNLFDFDMTVFGFEDEPEDDEEIEVHEDDFEAELPEEPKAKLGDVYQLGNHRLMCGDSTSITDVEKLMDGQKADLVFTDPPYGMKKESEGVENDNLNFDELLEFNKQWIPLTFASLKDNGSWYCWGIDEPLMDIYSNILKPMQKENKITFRNLLTWDKGNGQGQMNADFRMFPVADEKCLFVVMGQSCLHINSWKKKFDERYRPLLKYLQEQKQICGWDTPTMKTIAGCKGMVADHWTTTDQWRIPPKDVYEKFQNWARQNKKDAFLESWESLFDKQNEIKKQYDSERTYFDNTHDNMNNVWKFSRTDGEERASAGGHATPKPIALCSRAIKSSSRTEENVLDVFGGSGSTLIACEQLNRKAFLMELEPKWVDVIIARWEQFTGKKAVLLN